MKNILIFTLAFLNVKGHFILDLRALILSYTLEGYTDVVS